MNNLALELSCKGFCFLSANALYHDLPELDKKIISNSHIYFIVELPKASLDKNSLKTDIYKLNNQRYAKIILDIVYRYNGKNKKYVVGEQWLPLPLQNNEKTIRIREFPSIAFETLNENNELVRSVNANKLAENSRIKELNEYKVLYIGQSIGHQNKRNALDRVKSHATLQKILADCNMLKPDKMILIGMFEFHSAEIRLCTNNSDNNPFSRQENIEQVLKTLNKPLPLKTQISIIEASLIHYFQPEYNIKLKNKLPSQKSKTFSECCDAGFNTLIINLITQFPDQSLNKFLYTDTVKMQSWHEVLIDLRTLEKLKK